MSDLQPSVSVGILLASLAVHVEELMSPTGNAEFDGVAIRGILANPEVKAYLDTLRPLSLLPEKRS